MKNGELPGRLRAALKEHAEKIQDFHTELEGGKRSIWVHLRPEWVSPDMECGTIHETNSLEAVRKLGRVVPQETDR